MKTLIILPTYNEADNLALIIGKIMSLQSDLDVIVIDDNSQDRTKDVAQGLITKYQGRVFLIARSRKLGFASACIAGFRFALERDYDFIFDMDADLSHDPKEIPEFLSAMQDADVVVGSRYLHGIRIINWPLYRLILSYAANTYARLITGLRLTDLTSGYCCFSRRALRALPLDAILSEGYGFLIEVKFWAQRMGFKIRETPIVFTERQFGTSKISKRIIFESFFLVIQLFFKRLTAARHKHN